MDLNVMCAHVKDSTVRDFFQTINVHLRHYETIPCVFRECTFQTNIYSTFNTHRNRKHNQYSLKDFKANVLDTSTQLDQSDNSEDVPTGSEDINPEHETLTSDEAAELHLPHIIEEKTACILLKLENIIHIPKAVVDEVLSELHFILSKLAVPVTKATVLDVVQRYKLPVEESVADELAAVLCKTNPLALAIAKDGPLATAYKRTQFYISHFGVIQPVEYILDAQRNRSFQYIPLLQSLQQLLSHEDVSEHLKIQNTQDQILASFQEYRTARDGQYFKQNHFLSSEGLRIALNLYVDDFEICNPLGTSRKKQTLRCLLGFG